MIPSFVRDRLRRPPLSLVPAALLCCVTAWVFCVFNDRFLHHDFAYDESYFTWGGWCITKGLAPYRDFLEFKPPLLFLTHALALKLFGFAAFRYRWFFLFFPLGSVLALEAALVSRGVDALTTLAVGLAIVQLWVNPQFHDTALTDSESIGIAYYLLGLSCLLARTRLGDRLKIPGAAFLLACALSKEPFLLSVLATFVACFLLDSGPASYRADAVRTLKVTGTGAGVFVLALCLYMVPTGAMRVYIQTFIKYFKFYRDPLQSYCVVLGRFHPTTPLHDLVVQFQQARREYINLPTLGYLIPFLVVAVVFIGRRSLLLLGATAVTLVLAFHSVTASNCQWPHYYMLSMNGLFFAIIAGVVAMSEAVRSRALRRGVGAVLLGAAVVASWPRYEAERPLIGTRHFENYFRDLIPGALPAIAKYTTPADRIFTTGPPLVYTQSDRLGATRESTIIDEGLGFWEGKTDEERVSVLRAELEANMPKIFIKDPENERRKVRHDRALLTPFLTAHKYTEIVPHVWLRPY